MILLQKGLILLFFQVIPSFDLLILRRGLRNRFLRVVFGLSIPIPSDDLSRPAVRPRIGHSTPSVIPSALLSTQDGRARSLARSLARSGIHPGDVE